MRERHRVPLSGQDAAFEGQALGGSLWEPGPWRRLREEAERGKKDRPCAGRRIQLRSRSRHRERPGFQTQQQR